MTRVVAATYEEFAAAEQSKRLDAYAKAAADAPQAVLDYLTSGDECALSDAVICCEVEAETIAKAIRLAGQIAEHRKRQEYQLFLQYAQGTLAGAELMIRFDLIHSADAFLRDALTHLSEMRTGLD